MNSNKRVRESQNVYFGSKMTDELSDTSNDSIDFADALNRVDEKEMMDLLKCPLCTSVHTQVTLISKCLHRFCSECIHQKLQEDGTRICPVCCINLGCSPEQYLRNDKDMSLFAQILMEYFRVKKAMPENSHDDKLNPEASEVQAAPQDKETPHDYCDVTRKENDPTVLDESKNGSNETTARNMMPIPAFVKVYTKRRKTD